MGHRRFSDEDKRKGLAALIITGTSERASELTGIQGKTLLKWKEREPERYEQMRHELEPQLAKRLAADAEELTQRYQAAQHIVLDKMLVKVDQMDAKDLAGAARNLATSAALNVDKISSPLRERPSHVQHTQDLDELIRRMERLLGDRKEPVIDAQVVDESPSPALALVGPSRSSNVPGPQSA